MGQSIWIEGRVMDIGIDIDRDGFGVLFLMYFWTLEDYVLGRGDKSVW